MKDPREDKLPKWAQEALEAERRARALCWPSEPEPAPVMVCDPNTGAVTSGEEVKTGQLWRVNTGYRIAEMVEIDQYVAKKKGQAFGERRGGAYYKTERDALLALHWRECRSAAAALRLIQTKIDEI